MNPTPKKKGKKKIRERDLEGFKLLKPMIELLGQLQDKSDPKRKLHFDHYATLLLFYFFNPTLTSLRGLQAASEFKKVRRKLKIPRASLGSLSAAQHVFDPELIAAMIPDLVDKLPANKADHRLSELKEVVTLTDGTLLKALPRIAWALWTSEEQHAAKAHVQFEVLKGAPCRADITAAKASERSVLESNLEAGRIYVVDCGYAKFALFQAILDARSSFVGRLPDGWEHENLEERPLTEADRAARVTRDIVVRLGSSKSRAAKSLKGPVRIVEIQRVDEPSKRMRGERRRRGESQRETIRLVTNRLDLSAEMIALLYAHRWKIEIFFRWLKCTLGCKHLLAESRSGVAIQFYCALIASLLISLWTGKKPTKRLYEAICFYFQGFADIEEVLALVEKLKAY